MNVVLILSMVLAAEFPPAMSDAIQKSREVVAQASAEPKKTLENRLTTIKGAAVKEDDFAGAAAIKRYEQAIAAGTMLPTTEDLPLPEQALGAIDLYRQDLEKVAELERSKLFDSLGKIKDEAAQQEDYATATTIKEFIEANSESVEFLFSTDNDATSDMLTAEEVRRGWKLLFNGKDMDGWHGYQNKPVDQVWGVEDGAIVSLQTPGPDLLTDDEFGDFELTLDYKVGPGSNSGVFTRVSEIADVAHKEGPEYQIVDSARALKPILGDASIYQMYAPQKKAAKPNGEWNTLRILARRNRIMYFLNGTKIHDFEIGSTDWRRRFGQRPPQTQFPSFARAASGHIGLQCHTGSISFRNIKVRPLK